MKFNLIQGMEKCLLYTKLIKFIWQNLVFAVLC